MKNVRIPDTTTSIQLPLFTSLVPAGFPSPAEDYSDTKLDLNKHLIANPNSTFFVAIIGDSMINADIFSGDIAIVDRSIEPKNGDIILAVIDGDFTIKRFEVTQRHRHDQAKFRLLPENSNYKPIVISEHMNFQIWGVVTYTI
jgi:DNA polymerase V